MNHLIIEMIRCMDLTNKMSTYEKDCLLSELVCSYIGQSKSELMSILLTGTFEAFQEYVVHMNAEGELLAKGLKGETNEN